MLRINNIPTAQPHVFHSSRQLRRCGFSNDFLAQSFARHSILDLIPLQQHPSILNSWAADQLLSINRNTD